jgi:hypothetical protein
MAAPAWSAGVKGKVGQIVQRLRRVQFRHVPFYAACYTTSTLRIPNLNLTNVPQPYG